jgi:mannose/cellobiose epimerase-like protein (N-acyl-D-glucosamine 2-epimerase family)
MFRPAGSTPGHSFELGRLVIQHWDLSGRPNNGAPKRARRLIETALTDAWLPQGGFCYTLKLDGVPDVTDRYWWPVTEAIGALTVLLRLDPKPSDEDWYRIVWQFADSHLIDHKRGGWFPELGAGGQPQEAQFIGKPDIYHALQADLIALSGQPSRTAEGVLNVSEEYKVPV